MPPLPPKIMLLMAPGASWATTNQLSFSLPVNLLAAAAASGETVLAGEVAAEVLALADACRFFFGRTLPLLFISIGLIPESCPSDILESVCSTAESSLTVLSPPPLPPCPPPLLPPASNRIPSRLPPTVALASHSCFSRLRALSLSLALSLSPTTANRRSYCARARASLSLSRPFSPNALKYATCMASSYFSFEILVLPL
mmetsp:Transcript_87514/g.127982  ORF Transcript_87514/g.127982 Transcript_87514/m.127982 type:complete len:200 (+) Transcript_87514:852-1451(+)